MEEEEEEEQQQQQQQHQLLRVEEGVLRLNGFKPSEAGHPRTKTRFRTLRSEMGWTEQQQITRGSSSRSSSSLPLHHQHQHNASNS